MQLSIRPQIRFPSKLRPVRRLFYSIRKKYLEYRLAKEREVHQDLKNKLDVVSEIKAKSFPFESWMSVSCEYSHVLATSILLHGVPFNVAALPISNIFFERFFHQDDPIQFLSFVVSSALTVSFASISTYVKIRKNPDIVIDGMHDLVSLELLESEKEIANLQSHLSR